jgi:hypothetical protein
MNLRKHAVQVAAVAGIGLLWAAVGASEGLVLKRVEIVSGEDSARLVLDVDGAVTPRTFTLPNPDRIVVDLVGAVNAVPRVPQDFPTGPIAHVRVSQFQTTPQPVTRVVADLRVKVPYKVETQDEDIVLVVGAGAEAPTAAAATDGSTVAVTTPEPGTTTELPAVTAREVEAAATAAVMTEPVALTSEANPVATELTAVATEPTPATDAPVEVASTPAVTENPAAMEPVAVATAPVQAVAQTPALSEGTEALDATPPEDTSPAAPKGGVE